jgi:hypothetical protein
MHNHLPAVDCRADVCCGGALAALCTAVTTQYHYVVCGCDENGV